MADFTIPAEVHTDDFVKKVHFDALPFFQDADDDLIRELIEDGYKNGYGADAVAQELENVNPELKTLFEYMEWINALCGDTASFEVSVDQASAEAWLQAHRPHLLEKP